MCTLSGFAVESGWVSLSVSISANQSSGSSRRPVVTGRPHPESGCRRFVDDDGGLEIVAAVPTGQAELGTGLACSDGEDLVVTRDAEGHNSATAKRVLRIVRRFRTVEQRTDLRDGWRVRAPPDRDAAPRLPQSATKFTA
jgi:hypothetical protein